MSQDKSPDNNRDGYAIHVKMDSEVYYPVVSFNYSVTTINTEVASKIETTTLVSNNDDIGEVDTVDVTEKSEPTVLTNVIEKETSQPKQKNRILKRCFSGLTSVMVAIVVIIAATLVGMRLAGFRTFTVMSGSMSPEYPVGALIYVKPVDYYTLKEGDVISFVSGDDKTVVTHRIVGIEVDKKDSDVWRFRTQGDANEFPDANLVHYKNVLGTPIITIPFLGYFAHNVQQPPGIYIALVVGTLLLAWTFLPGTLEERRKTASKSVA